MASGSTLTMASSPLSTMHASLIESMPSDIIVKILEYAELRATVLLASRSNVMQNIVFQQCESSWVNIDFDGHSAISRPMRLTDTMLASLLVRVNARKITQSLTLFRTEKLRGFGLAPLILSQKLQSLRLDPREANDAFDTSIVLPILRTMIPYNLFYVRFGSWKLLRLLHGPPIDLNVAHFLSDLRTAKLKQARVQQTKCNCCQQAVTSEGCHLVAERTGPPSTRCETCQHHFCRSASCGSYSRFRLPCMWRYVLQ